MKRRRRRGGRKSEEKYGVYLVEAQNDLKFVYFKQFRRGTMICELLLSNKKPQLQWSLVKVNKYNFLS